MGGARAYGSVHRSVYVSQEDCPVRTYTELNRITQVFDSVADLAATVRKTVGNSDMMDRVDSGNEPGWFGGLRSLKGLWNLARDGWSAKSEDTVQVAESVVADVDREYELPTWQSRYDVAGSDVDVARYLSGEPENMITFDMVPTPTAGRVIAIAVNLAASSGMKSDAIITRGQAVVALVIALEKVGLRTEVYVDAWHASDRDTRTAEAVGRQLVLVKSADDALDVAALMGALAHPGFYRGLILGVHHAYPSDWQRRLRVGITHGKVVEAGDRAMLPEGTITVDASLRLDRDPNSPEGVRGFVIGCLRMLGLISD